MATRITFTCSECSEMFEETVQAFADAPGETVMAPVLCKDCGHGDDDPDRRAIPYDKSPVIKSEPWLSREAGVSALPQESPLPSCGPSCMAHWGPGAVEERRRQRQERES